MSTHVRSSIYLLNEYMFQTYCVDQRVCIIALTRLSIQCSKSWESEAYKGGHDALLKSRLD